MPPEQNTETRILEAAKSVFLKKGQEGARMQEIADYAKINKSLLHYYFRSKNKLFDAVFEYVFKNFSPNIFEVFNEEIPFREKIVKFVASYIDVVSQNPFIPVFVINEINVKRTDKLVRQLKKIGLRTDVIETQIREETEQGRLAPVNPKHFIVDIIALSVFPFIARPIFKEMLFNGNDEDTQQFLNERKDHVTRLILNYLLISDK
jgi:AcrR family transcriptional regulator